MSLFTSLASPRSFSPGYATIYFVFPDSSVHWLTLGLSFCRVTQTDLGVLAHFAASEAATLAFTSPLPVGCTNTHCPLLHPSASSSSDPFLLIAPPDSVQAPPLFFPSLRTWLVGDLVHSHVITITLMPMIPKSTSLIQTTSWG